MVTKRPDFDAVGGFVDAEYGDYDHTRLKGAFNLPVTDNLAFRVAGMMLQRDGYIENTAYGQVGLDGSTLPVIDDDVDGRDLWTVRLTGEWNITDRANLWVQYNHFEEDDDRARITNQICEANTVPTLGCTADGFGWDTPHLGSTTGGIFAGMSSTVALGGAVPLGSPGGNDDPNVVYNFPRPNDQDFRKMHTDFEPTYEYEEDLILYGFNYEFDKFSLGIVGMYQESEYVSRQDYLIDVGVNLDPVAVLNEEGFYPTSDVSGPYSGGFSPDDQCNYEAGTAGIFGGCVHPYGGTDRIFAYDHSAAKGDGWNIEAKLSSSFEGMFNFIVGASTYEGNSDGGDYYVNANTLDLVGTQGVPILGFPPLYPTLFNVPGEPGYKTGEGYAVFGEAYFDVTDRVKLTAGLRYNEDEKYTSSTSVLFNAINAAAFGAGDGNPLYWSRNATWLAFGLPYDAALVEYYGATEAFEAASLTAPNSPERLAADKLIPITPTFNETRGITGSPDTFKWDEVTGRIGVDWQVTDDSLLYLFFSRGYKPGGFNPPINPTFQSSTPFTFDPEEIDAWEIGTKNTFLDGTLTLNGALFIYDYQGLQVTRIANNTSINDNIDADIWGVELEGVWRPEALPGLQLDWAYSYLSTEVAGSESVDTVNRTAGNDDWTVLKNIDAGSLTAVTYIAPTADVLAVTPDAIASLGALSDANGTTVPGTTYPNGIPAYFSRSFLQNAGVETSDGIPTQLDGNSLPNSPENTIHLGVAYTWPIDMIAGSLTARWDYYWQDDMYAREFNTVGDQIDAWDQHNASLIYESNNGQWTVRAWIRNIEDEDNITGKYLTSDTSGFFRNYFLTEPRVYGASVRYSFDRR